MMCDGSFGGKEDVASRVRPGSNAVDVELVCVAIFEGDWLRCCEEAGSRALLGRNPAAWVSLYGNAGVIHYEYDMAAPESEVCHADGGSVGAVWIPDFRPCKNGAVG